MEQLHDHNQKTYENICRMYDEGIRRVAVVQPTGSGKSLLMEKLIEDNPNSNFFVLSTRHEINDQFKEKLDEEMLERVGFNIYWNMPNMKHEIMETLQPDYIFLDEMHRALAREWSKGIKVLLEMYPNANVLGLSATPIRYLDKCRNVAEELFNGNLACDMSLSEAILDGILPMARYVCGVYSYQKDAESLNKKIEKSCNDEEEKKELLKELKVLKENLDKGNGVSDIFRKYVSGSEKFVVFLKNTTHLGVMKPVIEKWFIDAGFSVRLYEVHCKNTDKDKEFQAFKEDTEDGIVKLCLSVNMVTEGIHGDIDGVIMLRETNSPNMYFQMIGRAFSCGKKTIPLIFDLVANSQFISDAADNFSNELRREIEKRKEECEKEGKDYEVGFDVDEFIVMDYFMDVVSGFKAIEGRLKGSWDLYIKALVQFKEREGDCNVPQKHIEIVDGVKMALGNWCGTVRRAKRERKKLILTKEREVQLNQMGFVWNTLDYNFEKHFKALEQYKKNNGDCLVPENYIEILDGAKIKLGQWCKVIRTIKNGTNKGLLDEGRERQLDQIGFIWDVPKYKFENNIRAIADYYKKYNDYPNFCNSDPNVKNMASFIYREKNSAKEGNYPEWKNRIIQKYLPDFFYEKKNYDFFNTLIFYAKMYKNKNGHIDIKARDVIENYNIGHRLNFLKKLNNNNKLDKGKIMQLEALGVYLGSKREREFDKKMELAKQAVKDGIIISRTNEKYKGVNLYNWIIFSVKKKYEKDELMKNEMEIIEKLTGKKFDGNNTQYKNNFKLCREMVERGINVNVQKVYKGVNLYNWIHNHRNQFSDKELVIINQLMPPNPQNISVRIVDIMNQNYQEYASISEAGRALHNEFKVIDSDNKGMKAIQRRLTGKIKNPIYKDRFRFEYADSKSI